MSTDVTRPIEEHPRRDELARLLRTVAISAADERRARFADGLEELMREAQIDVDDGKIDSFNVLRALQRSEPPVLHGRRLMASLLARGVALEPPADVDAAERIAAALAWLSAHTYLDALSAIDAELTTADAGRLWSALGRLVRDTDARGAARGRAEALAAAAALAASPSDEAMAIRRTLVSELSDPLLARAIATPSGSAPAMQPLAAVAAAAGEAPLCGELVPAPFSPVVLLLLCVSGLILPLYLGRFVARVLLRARRPAELRVAEGGVTVASKLEVLGRTVRERQLHIPLGNLADARREVRYPRLAMYAGLGALAIGTYLGVSLVTDALRAGSPSLLAMGAAIFGLGVACDFVMSSLWPTRRGHHRLVVVPRKGRKLALAVEDPNAADRALRSLERGASTTSGA